MGGGKCTTVCQKSTKSEVEDPVLLLDGCSVADSKPTRTPFCLVTASSGTCHRFDGNWKKTYASG